ncbi:CAP domain-containing protein [Demequina aurantiaca]|uniref:CAP domain-containing protein n=1 Tax=Demequina aurantiaca TaxID=676200 RepID=UPI0007827FBC|nr:CAP domain-containing protein [Demequina aurantiaca]
MTEQQDVLSPKRPRRHGNTILLGSIPVAVAITSLLTAGTWAPGSVATDLADSPTTAPITAPAPMPEIVAPGTLADAKVTFHDVTVTLPPPPPPKPVAAPQPAVALAAQKSTSTRTTTAARTSAAQQAPATKKASASDFTSYCANPKAPYTASGGPQALLAAANQERARLGLGKLSWSSSLASAATKWSKAMAAKDSTTDAPYDALAHNPNRPGAENVAVAYSSNGMGEGNAIARAHKNWMYSNGHCLNLMNPSYSTMGAGTAQTSDGTTWYTTQNFR